MVFPHYGPIIFWHREAQALLLVSSFLPHFMSTAAGYRTADNNLAAIMKQRFFLPACRPDAREAGARNDICH
jgi:hypothetical protein